jgi:ELWxxDGT repeat protein
MKRISLFLCTLFALTSASNAQVTRISNNTNLVFGFPINNSKAIFVQDETNNLWVTDGTLANTQVLAYPVTVDSLDAMALWQGKLIFSGMGPNGAELYVTDGTPAGTSMLKDIYTGLLSSHPKSMVLVNDQVFFFAETADAGLELWKTNGTPVGTVRIKDINPGPAHSHSENTLAYVHNGIMYFSAINDKGLELWRTDGTETGTYLLKDIFEGPQSSTPKFHQAYNNELYFSATDAAGGRELWRTNGSEAGTVRVKDIYPGPEWSNIDALLRYDGQLLFAASSAGADKELWISNGSEGGTFRLKDLNPGAAGSNPDLENAVVINNKVLFTAETAATGKELFITDGTEAGTGLFKDIIPGNFGSGPVIMTDHHFDFNMWGPNAMNYNLYNGKVFFYTGSFLTSLQLWVTDGSAANTIMLKDFGAVGLMQQNYIYTQSGLFFGALDADKGYEVFNSQGTVASTKLFADVYDGEESSYPFFQFFFLNGKVFFTADDGDSPAGDRDLFVIEASEIPLPLQLVKFGLAGIEAGVNLDWTTENEKNTHHFEVERSTDGVNFEKIGQVASKGNSQRANYNLLDVNAYKQKSNRLFYRLNMVDIDGKSRYSPIAMIQLEQQANRLSIYPNPVGNSLRLQFASHKKQDAEIRVMNASGQVVKRLNLQVQAGQNQQLIPVDQLAPGVYFTELILTDQKTQTERFIKQ